MYLPLLFHLFACLQVNNAGVLLSETERQLTPDGLEVTFATNTLGSTHVVQVALWLPVCLHVFVYVCVCVCVCVCVYVWTHCCQHYPEGEGQFTVDM